MMQVCFILTSECQVSIAEFKFDIDVNGLFPSVVILFACVLSFDTTSQILQNVFKQLKKTVSGTLIGP